MAQTAPEFFSKNMKWFALILLILLGLKSAQSCNRKTLLNMEKGVYIEQIDSLQTLHNRYYSESQDSIKKLNFELRLANEKVIAAQERVDAIERTVERIRANTTTNVVVKGAEEVKDTTEIKKENK